MVGQCAYTCSRRKICIFPPKGSFNQTIRLGSPIHKKQCPIAFIAKEGLPLSWSRGGIVGTEFRLDGTAITKITFSIHEE